jgi:hypothetical protein
MWSQQDGTECLVLTYDCEDILLRHEFLMHKHGASFDFPSYTPHVTLSYDVRGFNIKPMQDVLRYLPDIIIAHEYSEPLDMVTADINKTKGN